MIVFLTNKIIKSYEVSYYGIGMGSEDYDTMNSKMNIE